jgi:hypothetical protein
VSTEPGVTGEAPYLRVVKGDPTAEELAALVVAVQTAAPPEADRPATYVRGRWNDVESLLPPTLYRGAGAWTASGRLRGIRTGADR